MQAGRLSNLASHPMFQIMDLGFPKLFLILDIFLLCIIGNGEYRFIRHRAFLNPELKIFILFHPTPFVDDVFILLSGYHFSLFIVPLPMKYKAIFTLRYFIWKPIRPNPLTSQRKIIIK